MNNFSLKELKKFREKIIKENYSQTDIEVVDKLIEQKESDILIKESLLKENRALREDTATGGPSGAAGSSSVGFGGGGVSMANATTAGMGGVVSSQPSSFPGSLNGLAWASGGGSEGSGDISVPYNPGGANRAFQKLPAQHGSRGPKKSRKMSLKQLKNAFSKKQDHSIGSDRTRSKKVMDFNDFVRQDINKVTKVKEGKTYAAHKHPYKKDTIGIDTQDTFRNKIRDHIKALNFYAEQIGDDLLVKSDDRKEDLAEITFRNSYMGFRKVGNKYFDEFTYKELGKIKSKINDLKKEE